MRQAFFVMALSDDSQRVTADVQLSARGGHCPRPAATRYRTPCSPGRGQVTIRAWERRGQASCRDTQRWRKQLSIVSGEQRSGVWGPGVVGAALFYCVSGSHDRGAVVGSGFLGAESGLSSLAASEDVGPVSVSPVGSG